MKCESGRITWKHFGTAAQSKDEENLSGERSWGVEIGKTALGIRVTNVAFHES